MVGFSCPPFGRKKKQGLNIYNAELYGNNDGVSQIKFLGEVSSRTDNSRIISDRIEQPVDTVKDFSNTAQKPKEELEIKPSKSTKKQSAPRPPGNQSKDRDTKNKSDVTRIVSDNESPYENIDVKPSTLKKNKLAPPPPPITAPRVTFETDDNSIENLLSDRNDKNYILKPESDNITEEFMKKYNTSDPKIINRPVSDIIQSSKRAPTPTKRKEGIRVSILEATDPLTDVQYVPKDEESYMLIRIALMSNEFIKNLLDNERLNSMIEAMSFKDYPAGSYIIKEGETGSHLYVSDTGEYEIVQGGKLLKTFGPGEAFGELAILYKARRFASVVAKSDVKIWLLERKVFQKIMMRTEIQEEEQNIAFLSSVPILKDVHPTNLKKMSAFFIQRFFLGGMDIVKEGEKGDTFYIIKGGTVIVTKNINGSIKIVKELSKGEYFGERALIREDVRAATVTAKDPGVECLALNRGPFNEYLGNIKTLTKKVYPVDCNSLVKQKKIKEFDHITLDDLEPIGELGAGSFVRIELMHYKKKSNVTFTLKSLAKTDVIMHQQQKRVFTERDILFACKSQFVCKLYKTFKDNKYIYFLLEPLFGVDIWMVLQKHHVFKDNVAQFIMGCVIEAFDHLHTKNIIYRDLKPENLMIDAKGYIKLFDFGCAKFLLSDMKTFTFTGTPEYIAPEIIIGTGYDKAVDFWALGILVYELLAGRPPFNGKNHVHIYNLILRGVDAVKFDSKISLVARSLIRKLCRPLPPERLGYLRKGIKDIKNHKWFDDFDWKKLKDCSMKSPLMDIIHNAKDLSRFVSYEYNKEITPPDENSGWDIDF